MFNDGAIWFAAYPKSGNTWLRLLLEAYRRGGSLDINDVRITTSDMGATLIRGISPVPLDDLSFNGQMLLRPAALLNHLCRLTEPKWIKTHFANFQPDGLPHCVPVELTSKAVYVVRDPRSVLLSVCNFFNMPLEKAVEAMASNTFVIGDNKEYCTTLVSSWSNHVASWVSEKRYPVHVVKYEDMMEDTAKELTEVLEFLEQDVDAKLVQKAVEAASFSGLQKTEQKDGFREHTGNGKRFFNGGGTRWQQELGQKWIDKIQEDHGKVMSSLGYLDQPENLLHVVEK